MKNFTYFRPTTAEQAVALLENRWGNTELLAGGTDLLDLQKEYIAQPARIVSLGAINGLATVTVADKSATIGASTKLADIASHPGLRQHFPALTAAAGEIARPYRAPNGPEREHTLASNEMVVSVTIPRGGLHNAHYEVRQKQSSDWPLVQAAVAFQGGRGGANATNVKIVLGHVAPTPHLA